MKNPEKVAAAKSLFVAAAKAAVAAAKVYGATQTEAARLAYVAALNAEVAAYQRFLHFDTGNTHPFPR